MQQEVRPSAEGVQQDIAQASETASADCPLPVSPGDSTRTWPVCGPVGDEARVGVQDGFAYAWVNRGPSATRSFGVGVRIA
ncbi:predicted protein [Streptomyces viridosporus ATCC 14672]|uniref:Predicted protein n=1 Tax=Streptomyces viridosporus (strain ATCC 14672 / DSM 40746 / JCM 4963 / KCTC 9882 / NRRL B-12104 / FH 1290) TaxID=566461 RepID=D5ZNW9_STRV1|nr:predicted protein [Streptomyces viridosporus ATCC 14672]